MASKSNGNGNGGPATVRCDSDPQKGRTSGLGSIGVIVSHLDVSASDEKLGYKYTIILKALGILVREGA